MSTSPVIINDVWIGANSVILSGVKIGKHCVVGAGSIVTMDIPEYCVAIGNPGRIVKRYDFEKKEWVKLTYKDRSIIYGYSQGKRHYSSLQYRSVFGRKFKMYYKSNPS